MAEKSKQMVENTVSKGKDIVENNIIKPAQKATKSQK